jgi:hypothetical protein
MPAAKGLRNRTPSPPPFDELKFLQTKWVFDNDAFEARAHG